MSLNWTEIAAVATALAALATAFMAWKTATMADATKKDADASTASVEEFRRSRVLEWKPYLTIAHLQEATPEQGFVGFYGDVVNVGRGPALYAVWFWRSNSRWCMSADPLDISPTHRRATHIAEQEGPVPIALFADEDNGPVELHVLVCRDALLGHWYRFLPRQGTYEEWARKETEPEWHVALSRIIQDRVARGTIPLEPPL